MQMRSLPFWLMMASMARADFPVARSPMMSSRWPRPMGIMASMALMPVCTGVSTDLRATTLGAMRSTARVWSVFLAPRHLGDASGAAHLVAFPNLGVVAHDHGAHAILFQVEGDAHDSSRKLQQLTVKGPGQSVDAGDAVADLDYGAHV